MGGYRCLELQALMGTSGFCELLEALAAAQPVLDVKSEPTLCALAAFAAELTPVAAPVSDENGGGDSGTAPKRPTMMKLGTIAKDGGSSGSGSTGKATASGGKGLRNGGAAAAAAAAGPTPTPGAPAPSAWGKGASVSALREPSCLAKIIYPCDITRSPFVSHLQVAH